EPWALKEIQALNTYSEVSPSGTGVKCFCRAKLPGGGKNPKHNRVEIYDRGRFFTFTGQHLAGTPLTINNSQAAVTSFYARSDGLAPKYPNASDYPYSDFVSGLKSHNHDVYALLDDEDFNLSVGPSTETKRHPFLCSVAGCLWNGENADELKDILHKICERFC